MAMEMLESISVGLKDTLSATLTDHDSEEENMFEPDSSDDESLTDMLYHASLYLDCYTFIIVYFCVNNLITPCR